MTGGSPDDIDASAVEQRRIGRIDDGGRGLRERTLDSLRRADGPLPLAEVACRVATERSDCDASEVSREDVQRVYLSLARYQVPELERRGVVEYSDHDGTLRLAGPGTP